jgi:hypothetical protein
LKSGDRFRMIFDEVMNRNDQYFILADFDAYCKACDEADAYYLDKAKWAHAASITSQCLVTSRATARWSNITKTFGISPNSRWNPMNDLVLDELFPLQKGLDDEIAKNHHVTYEDP